MISTMFHDSFIYQFALNSSIFLSVFFTFFIFPILFSVFYFCPLILSSTVRNETDKIHHSSVWDNIYKQYTYNKYINIYKCGGCIHQGVFIDYFIWLIRTLCYGPDLTLSIQNLKKLPQKVLYSENVDSWQKKGKTDQAPIFFMTGRLKKISPSKNSILKINVLF